MTDYIKFENIIPESVAVLSVKSNVSSSFWEKGDCETVKRFLHFGALLEKGECLGWQMGRGEDEHIHSVVFSSPGVDIKQKDYDWIFEDSCIVDTGDEYKLQSDFAGNRKIYLISVEEDDCCGEYEYKTNEEDFNNMCRLLESNGAMVRIIVRGAGAFTKKAGLVMISLPEEMSLSMKAAVSLAIPAVEITQLTAGEALPDERGFFNNKYFSGIVTSFLKRVVDVEKAYMQEEKNREREAKKEKIIREGLTPIEDLGLSVRSFNCLMRAGILSLEELQTKTSDDLMKVRNLSGRGIEEIEGIVKKHSKSSKEKVFEKRRYLSYMDELDELIGLENVKEQVKKIAAFARMKKKMKEVGKDSPLLTLNMEFVGNPGTAKTTVARIVAGIFYEIGILSSNSIVEVGRADLIAKYVGQTAYKVKEVFKKASGRLLFIDEAYSMIAGFDGDYGDEAISTIVQEMENNRAETIVIFAGYPAQMDDFFKANPGLRSRVPFRISFDDYSAEEMLRIVKLEAYKKGFELSGNAVDKVLSVCKRAEGVPEVGNGRFCRNLVDKAVLDYAARTYGGAATAKETDFVLEAEDFNAPESVSNFKKDTSIGFVA